MGNQKNQKINVQEWEKIESDILKNLIESMPQRVEAVIEEKNIQPAIKNIFSNVFAK